MSIGDFSPSQDSEGEAFRCTPGIIPILPVRFSLQPYDNILNPAKPTSITAPGDYILRTLRQGFVYIFIEAPEDTKGATNRDGTWYNFRYMTYADDVNSAATPARVKADAESSGRFRKYEWTENYGRGEWKYASTATPWCWVPAWASKIWVAYSEYAWPPEFFEKGHDAAFRQQVMMPVMLRGPNKWAAMVGDAERLVEEFKDPKTITPLVRARLAQSQTGFASMNNWEPVITDANKDCIALVAVHDPVGDVAEMYFRTEMIRDAHLQLAEEYMYPLTIGQFCAGIKDHVPKRDGILNRTLPDWMINGPALAPGWEIEYQGIKSMVEARLAFLDELANAIAGRMNDESDHMLGKLMSLANERAEATKDPDAHIAEYLALLASCPLLGLACTQRGIDIMRKGLGANDIQAAGLPGIDKWLGRIRTIWGAVQKQPFARMRQAQYSFRITFEALAVPLGMQIAAGTQPVALWRDALNAGFQSIEGERLLIGTTTKSLDEAIRLLQSNHETGNSGRRYTASPMDVVLDTAKDAGRVRVGRVVGAGPTADVPYVRTQATVTLAGGTGAERAIFQMELGHQLLGVMLSSWALHSAVYSYKASPTAFSADKFTEIGLTFEFQLATAAISVATSIQSTYKLLARARETGAKTIARLSTEATKTLYKNVAVPGSHLTNTVSPSLRGAVFRGDMTDVASIAGKRLKVHAFALVGYLVGAVTGAMGVGKGIARRDKNEIIANTMMLIGGLMMIPGAGWILATIGAVIIAIGFLISLTVYDAIEDIARLSFWGTHPEYWGGTRPATKRRQVEMARGMRPPYDKHLESEVGLFAELTWAPVISNPTDGDGEILIRSGAIAAHGADAVTVQATVQVVSPRGDAMRNQTVPTTRRVIPGTDAIAVTIPKNNWSNIPGVTVTATVRGPRSGYTPPKAEMHFSDP